MSAVTPDRMAEARLVMNEASETIESLGVSESSSLLISPIVHGGAARQSSRCGYPPAASLSHPRDSVTTSRSDP